MKKLIKNTHNKIAKKLLVLTSMFMLLQTNCFAAGTSIADSKIATGIKKLLQDGSLWLTGISATVAILIIIVIGIKVMINKITGDEHGQEAKMLFKKMQGVFVILAIIFCASGLVAIISFYFG